MRTSIDFAQQQTDQAADDAEHQDLRQSEPLLDLASPGQAAGRHTARVHRVATALLQARLKSPQWSAAGRWHESVLTRNWLFSISISFT